MSQENVEVTHDKRQLAEEIATHLNARDFDALAELPWHPAGEFHSIVGSTEGRVYYGIQGLREWAATVDETWDEFRIELLDFREVDGDRAVVVLRLTGRAKISGAPLDARIGQVWTWKSGRLWRNQAYNDPAEAFGAVGLRE